MPDVTPMPRALAPAKPPGAQGGRASIWRGVSGAIALAAWSVAGVIGAALALIPVALEPGPRGRTVRSLAERGPHRLGDAASPTPDAADAEAEPVPAARAAGGRARSV